MTPEEQPTNLAERCFDASEAESELYRKLLQIVSREEKPTGYPVLDCWVDPYDGSVEIVLWSGVRLRRDQANDILALGFGVVFESFGEEKGVRWTKTGDSPCTARKGDDANKKTFVAQTKLEELTEKVRGWILDLPLDPRWNWLREEMSASIPQNPATTP